MAGKLYTEYFFQIYKICMGNKREKEENKWNVVFINQALKPFPD
jgi:hypothetical protein